MTICRTPRLWLRFSQPRIERRPLDRRRDIDVDRQRAVVAHLKAERQFSPHVLGPDAVSEDVIELDPGLVRRVRGEPSEPLPAARDSGEGARQIQVTQQHRRLGQTGDPARDHPQLAPVVAGDKRQVAGDSGRCPYGESTTADEPPSVRRGCG